MLTLYTDVETTRRKRLHHVLDEHETPKWSGANVCGALEFLYESGENEFWIQGQGSKWLVMIHPEPD